MSTGTLWLLGCAISPLLLDRRIEQLRLPAVVLGSVAVACLFSILWYLAIGAVYGWIKIASGGEGVIPRFYGPAFRWQLLQGTMAGAGLLLLTDAVRARRLLAEAVPPQAPAEREALRSALLLREGDELIRVSTSEISQIVADGNEVVVHSGQRRFRLRRTLSELEEDLPETFVRIHRSRVVNLDAIDRMEPAGGGRLTVHLTDGNHAIASRSGAGRLKQRVI